ncbi:uncharacterized protein LOC110435266 [Sorghum bicolor]|uniref:uncharacterized protein LOC110435266 n=1 Tax=Sorghum bicolor TaxID=4558 RepID=UPI000B42505D|nr:uncharacterized protein LOC110435266 [Sorghum bicolor]|eukprot:XP_021316362.1 uncharacterized protein LOC110435266 [Sorghum bicolor]
MPTVVALSLWTGMPSASCQPAATDSTAPNHLLSFPILLAGSLVLATMNSYSGDRSSCCRWMGPHHEPMGVGCPRALVNVGRRCLAGGGAASSTSLPWTGSGASSDAAASRPPKAYFGSTGPMQMQ